MIKTHGLTHISLKVADMDKSVQFYKDVFGVVEYYRDEQNVQVKGPGPKDILVFEKSESNIGVHAGVSHFGFRLTDPKDIDKVVQEVVKAGGTIWKQGEFSPTETFVFFTDIDGYSIEIWYED